MIYSLCYHFPVWQASADGQVDFGKVHVPWGWKRKKSAERNAGRVGQRKTESPNDRTID